jgi:N-acetylneuraminic acid mutarotase
MPTPLLRVSAVLVLAACGGSSSSESPDGAAFSDGGSGGGSDGGIGADGAGDDGTTASGDTGADAGEGGAPDGGVHPSPGWHPIATAGAPAGRGLHSAVWTGSEMIVWGGHNYDDKGNPVYLGTGGRYDPATDTWRPTSTVGAPAGRAAHAAVWTGNEMIVWGGFDGGRRGDGARYDPVADAWRPMSATSAPTPRSGHAFVWTGGELVVWGGEATSNGQAVYPADGARYDPALDQWTSMAAPSAPILGRAYASSVWTGAAFLLWGGYAYTQATGSLYESDGHTYDPAANAWPSAWFGGPGGRSEAPAVWTGSEMMVWGGEGGSKPAGDGARYAPATNTWTPMMSIGAPPARIRHSVVWTQSRFVVWGGASVASSTSFANDGAAYDPNGNAWTALPTQGAPSGRADHSAVWTGAEMIVWGGLGSLADGGRWAP